MLIVTVNTMIDLEREPATDDGEHDAVEYNHQAREPNPKIMSHNAYSLELKTNLTPVSCFTVVFFFPMYQVCDANVECCECPDTDNNILRKIGDPFQYKTRMEKV